ncbi:unnamed protein product [Knipowitschia caucasica]|uniref:Ceramide synthase 5 n=1 Tax=Knipowitschia caucasica TaxID=637954 RepID=A0AAV2LX32_KNICA
MASAIVSWVWRERFWFPDNVTWADLESGVDYPQAGHLLYALPLALVLFILRLLFERLVAKPCANILHIQTGERRRAQPNPLLEKVFKSKTSPDHSHLEQLATELKWEVRRVQRWFRLRRDQNRPTTETKFCESMWRFTFYGGIFVYTVYYMWDSPWMWNTRHCWTNYPFQPMIQGQYIHYFAEFAFYWSLMFSQFIDIKRKDFLIMFIHHFATLLLITFSYGNNMLRAGALVMCVHDASDIFLEAAKLANYAKYQRLCDILFVLFTLVFFITRLIIFPFWVIHSVLIESWEIVGPYQAWWLLNSLLLVLQVLHIYWFYLITRIAVKSIFKGRVSKDDRSDIESSSEDEEINSNCNKKSV